MRTPVSRVTGPAIDLAVFKDLVRTRCGLMFEGLGEDTLAGAVRTRMQATGAASPQAYLAKLIGHEDEFHDLITLLTINETYFFREPQQFALLTGRIIPRLLARPGRGLPIRILSAGCSSGEEPYSIAITLLEQYGESAARMFSIQGCDIDHQALTKARTAMYSSFSFRATPEELYSRYFVQCGPHAHRLVDEVRALVDFHPLNLLANAPPAALMGVDLVLFRNVSIYFDAPTRVMIQKNLKALVKEDGYLVVGLTETLANDLGVFSLVAEDGLFYFAAAAVPADGDGGRLGGRTVGPGSAERPPGLVASPSPSPWLSTSRKESAAGMPVTGLPRAGGRVAGGPIAASASVPSLGVPAGRPGGRPGGDRPPMVGTGGVTAPGGLEGARRLVGEDRYDEARAVLAGLLDQQPEDPLTLVLDAYVRLHMADVAGAEGAARKALAVDAWSVEACVVLGFAARQRQDHEAAIRWFKQAAYARHDCWVVQYYLGEAYRAAGRLDQAKRVYKVALHHLNGERPQPDGGLHLPLRLPMADIRFLCERHGAGAPGRGGRG